MTDAPSLEATKLKPWASRWARHGSIRHFEETHGLVALSANFALYGDLSDRVASIIAGMGPAHEVYSTVLVPRNYPWISGIGRELSDFHRC